MPYLFIYYYYYEFHFNSSLISYIFRLLGKEKHHLFLDFLRRHTSTRMGCLWIVDQKRSTMMLRCGMKSVWHSWRNKLRMAHPSNCPRKIWTIFEEVIIVFYTHIHLNLYYFLIKFLNSPKGFFKEKGTDDWYRFC